MYNEAPLERDLSQVQVHFRRGAQDWFDQRQRHPRQSLETTPESVADQKSHGDILDPLWRAKEPDSGISLSDAAERAAHGDRAKAIRDLL